MRVEAKVLTDDLGPFEGEFSVDPTLRQLYATDASVYEEMPLAVAHPRSEADLAALIKLAARHGVGLIPRTAGTSLAGQVVGSGMVVDMSRHMTRILSVDSENRTVLVEPGVIRNELNQALARWGLFFGPETSTQNRAMMGGMLGNNSCGSNSVVYGSVRDQIVSVSGFLSDGNFVEFGAESNEDFNTHCAESGRKGAIYRQLKAVLGNEDNRRHLFQSCPHADIPRRNTGYALDLVARMAPFSGDSERPLNLAELVAGSEGTLMLVSQIRLKCVDPPPVHVAHVCAHFSSVDEALQANLIALQADPFACELMDHYILEGTERNIEFRRYRFFIEGQPKAILVTELRDSDPARLEERLQKLQADLKSAGLGFAYPVVRGADCAKVWEVRNAGLGLLSNIPGDAKPLPVIEDTAVRPVDLPAYIAELTMHLRDRYGIECVHYAHAGTGELHLRPVLNLKTGEGNRLFRQVLADTAEIVKRYRGSLSGEHGDGRLRGEFIEAMVGETVYGWMKELKKAWDPENRFNPGKIIDVPRMNTHLRYRPGQDTPEFKTYFRWESTEGFLRAAEMCNGTAACRKTHHSGGTMCPSYMATRDEKDTTRARANRLRFVLTQGAGDNPFMDEGLKEVMDLCLSCKGCKSECPSNVDVARMKAEILQQRYDAEGIPFRSRLIGHYTDILRMAARCSWIYNALFKERHRRQWLKRTIGFAEERSMPPIAPARERRVFTRRRPLEGAVSKPVVYLFRDEFTSFLDATMGNKAVALLESLGYAVVSPVHLESGRSALSKGLLKRARSFAEANVRTFSALVSEDRPLVGIEPSAILGFRDEYPDLVEPSLQAAAEQLAPHCLTIEEFLWREVQSGKIETGVFTDDEAQLIVHGHCHAKALCGMEAVMGLMNLPRNYEATAIDSGCCGMAGSFGYEQEHYALSQKIGELVLFPAVRATEGKTLIVASGTSCRHQILDGTGKRALHPVEVLFAALQAGTRAKKKAPQWGPFQIK
jgi:FAD/FMN-containing dehydrogenase/Fe-S oxidoreductase